MTPVTARLIPFADAWSMHDGDVGFGWWVIMMVFWGAVIAAVVWALLRGGAAGSRVATREPTARELLDRRLADGSLSVEEYERRRRLLDDGAAAPVESHIRVR